MTDQQPLLRLRGLTKSFQGALALDQVDLTVMRHEVHGLLGENGSGKSTLIKVLSGFHEPDGGTLEVSGTEVPLPLRPGQYRELGFEFVHQDLGLVPSLTVAENLFLGETAASRGPFYSWRKARARAVSDLSRYGVDLDPTSLVERIRPVDRAMLAIVRAIVGLERTRSGDDPTLLVLDEPTVFLPEHEVGVLFDFVRGVANAGSSVLFVSHDLDEVKSITDRVTVLRDGRTAGSAQTSEISKRDLVRLIVGHDVQVGDQTGQPADAGRQAVLSVDGLTSKGLRGVSFQLHEGEVLGFAGLVGSGYEDIVYAVYGADRSAQGRFSFADQQRDLKRHTPAAAVRMGMALVPADRKNDGSVATLSAADNINLTVLDRFFSGGLLRRGRLRANAQTLMTSFDVRPAEPELDYGSFSGGNQQKAMMAKWQQVTPKLLLLHEPTQGVDVGAREQIYRLIRGATQTTSTIVASSDYEQLATICDRVGIVVRGRLVDWVSGDELHKSRIADLCQGRSTDHADGAAATDPASTAPTDADPTPA